MDIEINKRIAEIVKAWVDNSSYTQTQLSRILGISKPVLNLQLNGKNPIPVKRITRLAEILNPPAEEMELISSLILGTNHTEEDEKLAFQVKARAKLKQQPEKRKEEAYKEIMANKAILSQIFKWASIDSSRCKKLIEFIESQGEKLEAPFICRSTDIEEVIATHPLLDLKTKDQAIWNAQWYKNNEIIWKHYQNIYHGKRREILDGTGFLNEDELGFVLRIINRFRLIKDKAHDDAMMSMLFSVHDNIQSTEEEDESKLPEL